MSSDNNSDTTYLTPIVVLLLYSFVNFFREVKNTKWIGDDVYEPYYDDYYAPKKKEPYIPTKEDIKNEIAELETDWWYLAKRSFCNFFGLGWDDYEHASNSLKSRAAFNNKEYNKKLNERWNKYVNNYYKQEIAEYNMVAKQIGRSCEIHIDKQ